MLRNVISICEVIFWMLVTSSSAQKLFPVVLKQVVSHLITSSHNTTGNPMSHNLFCLNVETQLELRISQDVFLGVFCIHFANLFLFWPIDDHNTRCIYWETNICFMHFWSNELIFFEILVSILVLFLLSKYWRTKRERIWKTCLPCGQSVCPLDHEIRFSNIC